MTVGLPPMLPGCLVNLDWSSLPTVRSLYPRMSCCDVIEVRSNSHRSYRAYRTLLITLVEVEALDDDDDDHAEWTRSYIGEKVDSGASIT